MRKLLLTICLLSLAVSTMAQSRRYLTLGRDPMIPGGLTVSMIENRGWEPAVLLEDTWLTMWGAKGERVTGWVKKGTRGAWDQYGRFVLGPCGNYTDLPRPAKPTSKPDSPPLLTVYRDRWNVGPSAAPETVEKDRIVHRHLVVRVFSPTIQPAPPIGPPTQVFGGGGYINYSPINVRAYGAAAAAAAAAASTSAVGVTPTSGAATSGGSAGSSGSSAGGGRSNSGSS